MRCGTKLHNGTSIPVNVIIKISPLGREYYISGLYDDQAVIRYLDNGEIKWLPARLV